MIDIKRVKMHISSAGCLGEEFTNKSVFVLDDMESPIVLNGCQSLMARRMKLSEDETECSLSKKIVNELFEKGHNLFAFYCFDKGVNNDNEEINYLRFASTSSDSPF